MLTFVESDVHMAIHCIIHSIFTFKKFKVSKYLKIEVLHSIAISLKVKEHFLLLKYTQPEHIKRTNTLNFPRKYSSYLLGV